MKRSAYHLILDRSRPATPRWVVAKELSWRPAADVDHLDPPDGDSGGVGGSRRWLRAFGIAEFDWLREVFGRDTFVQNSGGNESYSTRLSPHGGIWRESDYVSKARPAIPLVGWPGAFAARRASDIRPTRSASARPGQVRAVITNG